MPMSIPGRAVRAGDQFPVRMANGPSLNSGSPSRAHASAHAAASASNSSFPPQQPPSHASASTPQSAKREDTTTSEPLTSTRAGFGTTAFLGDSPPSPSVVGRFATSVQSRAQAQHLDLPPRSVPLDRVMGSPKGATRANSVPAASKWGVNARVRDEGESGRGGSLGSIFPITTSTNLPNGGTITHDNFERLRDVHTGGPDHPNPPNDPHSLNQTTESQRPGDRMQQRELKSGKINGNARPSPQDRHETSGTLARVDSDPGLRTPHRPMGPSAHAQGPRSTQMPRSLSNTSLIQRKASAPSVPMHHIVVQGHPLLQEPIPHTRSSPSTLGTMNGRNGNGNAGPTTNGRNNVGGREAPVRALPLGPRAQKGHNKEDAQGENTGFYTESNKPIPGEQISANGGYEKVDVSLPRASTPPTRNYAPDSGLGAAGRVEEAHLSTASKPSRTSESVKRSNSTTRFVERKDTSNARFLSPHTSSPQMGPPQHGPGPMPIGERTAQDAAYMPYNMAHIVPSGPSQGPIKDPSSNIALLQNQLKDGERFWQLHNANAQRHVDTFSRWDPNSVKGRGGVRKSMHSSGDDAPTPTVPLQSQGERIQQVFHQLNAPFRDIVPK